jgi:hypothetical protein
VSPRSIEFLAAVVLLFVSLAAIGVHHYLRARRSSRATWESLLNRLTFVDRAAIARIALDVIDESGHPRKDETSATLESAEIWKLIGGWNGIEALGSNCTVLIDMAFYVQQWYPEALAVAEQLRLSAREIEWHVERLRSAAKSGKLESSILMNGQRAAVAYYLMTRYVLALHQYRNLPMLADLQRAL